MALCCLSTQYSNHSRSDTGTLASSGMISDACHACPVDSLSLSARFMGVLSVSVFSMGVFFLSVRTAALLMQTTRSTRSASCACLRLQPASWGTASLRVPSHPCRSSPCASRAPTRRLNDVDCGLPARAPWPAAAPPWPSLAWRSSAPPARTCAPPRALTRGRTPTTRHSRASSAAHMQRVNP
jgi:hypothetical protein